MNEEMMRDTINQLETDLRIMRANKEYYEQFFSPCMKIYNARILMDSDAVVAGIEEIENLLRDKSKN